MKHLLVSSFLLLLLLPIACGSRVQEKGTRNAPDDSLSLRVAVLPTVGCLPVLYAVESGLADSLGLPLRYKLYRAQWDADTALLGRTVDAGYIDATRLDYYRARGQLRNATALVPMSETYRLVVGGHLRVRKMEHIKQRTIAAPRYTHQERYLHFLRDSLRLKQDDLYQPQINSYEIATRMLDNEQLDGLVLPEPWATQVLTQGHRVLGTAQQFHAAGIYVKALGRKETRKTEQLRLFKRVYNLAVKQLNGRRTPLVDSLFTQRYKLTPEAAAQVQLPRYRPLP